MAAPLVGGKKPGKPGGGSGPPSNEGGIIPNPKGPLASNGEDAMRSRSNSDSCSLLDLALLFWNQIFTWVSVSFKEAENSALSAIDKYCF